MTMIQLHIGKQEFCENTHVRTMQQKHSKQCQVTVGASIKTSTSEKYCLLLFAIIVSKQLRLRFALCVLKNPGYFELNMCKKLEQKQFWSHNFV